MIIVTSPSKPFTYTAKGSVRRLAIIKEYEAEIDAAYAAVNESSQDDIPAPLSWNLSSTKQFVRQVVGNTMKTGGKVASDDVDLFQMGLDRFVSYKITSRVML